MIITKVEPIFVGLPYDQGAPKPTRRGFGDWDVQPILFVRVETDAGITGWGEAFSHASTPVTMTAITEIDDYDVIAQIRRAVRVPIAAGENLGNYATIMTCAGSPTPKPSTSSSRASPNWAASRPCSRPCPISRTAAFEPCRIALSRTRLDGDHPHHCRNAKAGPL